jgi:hypothetical protein
MKLYCPFCGHCQEFQEYRYNRKTNRFRKNGIKPAEVVENESETGKYFVLCRNSDCRATGPSVVSKKKAIEAFASRSRRKPQTATAEKP